MKLSGHDPRPPEAAAGLSHHRTVDRTLLHRHHLTEVFLTDIRRTGADSFVAAALLPAVHPHYTSHSAQTSLRHLDPMLLLECCRQAETAAAHLCHGVDRDSSFVLRNWSMELTDEVPRGLPGTVPVSTELTMTALTHDPRHRAGRLSGLSYAFTLWAAGARLGDVRMEVGYVAREAYRVMRRGRRTGPPPSSDTCPPAALGTALEPARAGRLHARDTLLLDAVARATGCTATLRPAADNPSLFDHPQDHVPGMVLVEAARQLAAFAVAEGGATAEGAAGAGGRAVRPEQSVMVTMRAAFFAYAELDAPTTMTALPGREHRVEVTFRQNGADIATVELQLAALTGHRGTDGTDGTDGQVRAVEAGTAAPARGR
ncbi:AfsA-related hotdog domain-containing protein [Streptomyces sp. NPDC017940]|uniref:AfsA-related hotdog domain-containing protein n=1 Tax=Streptomyces sp. NPDC017940 TaxID=3365017 RepID=UPI0037876091